VPLKALVQELGRFKNAELIWCRKSSQYGCVALHGSPISNGAEPDPRAEQTSALRRARRLRGDRYRLMSKHLAQLKALLDERAKLALPKSSCRACRGHPTSHFMNIDLRRGWPGRARR